MFVVIVRTNTAKTGTPDNRWEKERYNSKTTTAINTAARLIQKEVSDVEVPGVSGW
jgi:hypothetical protein